MRAGHRTLTRLASEYATITGMDAGYPPSCPSLPAYLLMTSGSTHGVCDDAGPDAHPIGGAVDLQRGRERRAAVAWVCRGNARSVRPERRSSRALPRAARTGPLLHVARGALPVLGPSSRHSRRQVPCTMTSRPAGCPPTPSSPPMPATTCTAPRAAPATWSPRVTSGCPAGCRRSSPGPTTRAGRLVVVITWDEGSTSSNHIPTIVVGPTGRGVRVTAPVTHCGLLGWEERILGLPLLGCAPDGARPRPRGLTPSPESGTWRPSRRRRSVRWNGQGRHHGEPRRALRDTCVRAAAAHRLLRASCSAGSSPGSATCPTGPSTPVRARSA